MKLSFYYLLILLLLSCKTTRSSNDGKENQPRVKMDYINGVWWEVSDSGGRLELGNDLEKLPPARGRNKWEFDLDQGLCSVTKPGPTDRPQKLEGDCYRFKEHSIVIVIDKKTDTLTLISISESSLQFTH